MFKKLRWRLTATYIALIIISMLILGLFLLFTLRNYYYDNLQEKLETEALLAAQLVNSEIGSDWNISSMETLVKQLSENTGARVTVIDLQGKVFGDSEENAAEMENHSDRPEIQKASKDIPGMEIRHSDTLGIKMMYTAVPVLENNSLKGYMRLAIPIQEVQEAFIQLWSAVVIAIFLVLVCTIPISLTLGKRITKPTDQLINFARQVSKGDFDKKAQVINKDDEIGKLASTLNQMTETINEKMKVISEERSKLETVLNNMISGVIFVNKHGKVDLVNPAAEKFLSFLAGESTGFPHTTVLKYSELSVQVDKSLENGELVEKEIHLSYPEEMTIETVISPIQDNTGTLIGTVIVLHDITEIRRVEKMRKDFVANVSHELKTPVTSLKGFTETLLDGAIYEPEVSREFIEIIDEEAERLSRLIQDLLDLSKIESKKIKPKFLPADMRIIAKNVVSKLQNQIQKAGHNVELKLPDKEMVVDMDQDLISQVLTNLIDNAVNYTPYAGTIKIEITEKEHNVVLWVKDNGLGIPPKDLDRIFERFYRVDKTRSRKKGGTGLGLSIVKHIIDIHGGTVGVNSTQGKGSEFFFTLPKRQ